MTLVEMLLLVLGAIILGFTIHFIITNRMPMAAPKKNPKEDKLAREVESWKDRFFTETELRDKQIDKLKQQLAESEENTEIYTIEAEEVRKENKELKQKIKQLEGAPPPVAEAAPASGNPDKSLQLRDLAEAQESMALQQERFRELLEEMARSAQSDDKVQTLKEYAEELELKVEELELQLSRKEQEMNQSRRQQKLSAEMNSMLENAYAEFGQLQEKLKKLEAQAVENKKTQVNYADLRESHQRLTEDLAEWKNKHTTLHSEYLRMQHNLEAAEDMLKQAQFDNQQLQNRLAQYEALDSELKAMEDSNKKLENQLKRIGELESMLNMMAEEREQLLGRKP